jgi:hypothetical protein
MKKEEGVCLEWDEEHTHGVYSQDGLVRVYFHSWASLGARQTHGDGALEADPAFAKLFRGSVAAFACALESDTELRMRWFEPAITYTYPDATDHVVPDTWWGVLIPEEIWQNKVKPELRAILKRIEDTQTRSLFN